MVSILSEIQWMNWEVTISRETIKPGKKLPGVSTCIGHSQKLFLLLTNINESCAFVLTKLGSSIVVHSYLSNHNAPPLKYHPSTLPTGEVWDWNVEKRWIVLTHWGRDKMAAVSQTTHSDAFSWMKMLEFRLRFRWSLFLRVQLTIFQHWFR